MANLKISQLPSSTAATGTELIAVVQSAQTRKMTLADALALAATRCVWSRNFFSPSTGGVISNAGLSYISTINGIGNLMTATRANTTGKRYFEVKMDVVTGAGTPTVGVTQVASVSPQVGQGPAPNLNRNSDWGLLANNGNKYAAGKSTAYGSALVANDILMVAVDLDADRIWWGKNGTWFASGNPGAGTGAAFTNVQDSVYPAVTCSEGSKVTANFAGPFQYTLPSGFVSWEA